MVERWGVFRRTKHQKDRWMVEVCVTAKDSDLFIKRCSPRENIISYCSIFRERERTREQEGRGGGGSWGGGGGEKD